MLHPEFPLEADRQPARWQDYVVAQNWSGFSDTQHAVWDTLFARQLPYLGTRIVSPFLSGIPVLGLDRPGIPELAMLNARLTPLSGWTLVPVAGIVPDAAFFAMLSKRIFPIGNFIRGADSLDYLEEPDCFHDIFGHVPMLASPAIGRLMQALGKLGVEAIAAGHGEAIARLYWHSVEFGLARESGEVRILGAGLASSFGEAHFALEADVPRPRFTLSDAANTPYRNDRFQPLYFVADSLDEAASRLEALDLAGLKALAGPL
ncbi:MAG: phenylalanine 4-monooxygenase [Sphingomicrobium sp.]